MKNTCTYSAAIAYTDKPGDLPEGFYLGTQAPTRIYTVEHVGPYDHLGNAWSAMHSLIRAKG